MPFVSVPNCGSVGVIRDLSQHELPINAWTDSSNIRFLDGYCYQFYGYGQVYGTPAVTPLHTSPAISPTGTRYWLYASDKKIYAAYINAGAAVHTNLTRQTAGVDVDYSAQPNEWTSTNLGGVPILNPGNKIDPPQQWSLDPANRCTALSNWPANTYCKSMRAYKVFLVALGVTKAGQEYPYMVKWSTAADPGAVPATWDPSNAAELAGEYDLATGGDRIVDGLPLGDALMIYKENSIWRMSFIGGQDVMGFQKVFGESGALNRNCVVDIEVDGQPSHFVVTANDVIVHNGSSHVQVLDKQARRALFQDLDTAAVGRTFVFKNPFLNEVFICYASIGNSVPNKALVWNYKDKTVSYRTMPNVNHAACGSVDNTLNGTWDADGEPWDSDLTKWNGPDFTPNASRVMMASNDTKFYLLDSSASYDGVLPSSYVERVGLSFGTDVNRKLVRSIRPRITGNDGDTVIVQVGTQQTPYSPPTYTSMTYTIGSTLSCDCMVEGRYIAIRFENGTAFNWRLDSFDIDVQERGRY
ncbi:hypothetical protein IP92_05752 [Pseudoduganella flava]|uniref:Uncharacterized protein n=1 Tax=Pseudoduganella flava TaxID=871742 RepID=A0A562P9B1_9BURK|nr:hypothetical protein [Pseudoduganella flava]QGZ42715.1 hypothetical protein GO485_29230 [Pseudoduganella flava]TWI41032.1 hypothetical protein IP92_05752 [Pseudoduganella flava]